METVIKIKTWKCPVCDYHQDFEEQFCRACLGGNCRCGQKGSPHEVLLIKETDPIKKTTITIMDEADVDTHKISTGKVLPDGKPEMRDLTFQEKQEFKKKIKDDIVKYKKLED